MKSQQMEKPISPPAIIGAQKEMLEYDVQPNQKNAIVKIGAARTAISKRNSGGTGCGAHLAIWRS